MTNINYMPEQQAVLNSTNKNLIVSASAGSGKTTIMIQKILDDLVKRNKKIKSILVLTYTKASAEEMKQRLLSKLYENAENSPNLISEIDDLAVSDISTIHSFFQKMLKKYFTAIDIEPDFSILDDTQAKKFQETALELAIEKFGETNSENFQNLIEIFGKTRNDKDLKKVINKINSFLKALPNPKTWISEISTKLYDENLEKNQAIKIINDKIFSTINYYIGKLKNLQTDFETKKILPYINICNLVLSHLECVKPNQEKFLENYQILCNFLLTRITIKDFGFENERNLLKSQIEDIKDFCKKIKKWSFTQENIENFLKFTPSIVNSLLKIQEIFQEEFANLKKKTNYLDYDDLEKFMLKVLENENIKNEIINSYDEIYVDEYQDANRLQEKILSTICKKNNRFMVGDVKQSIYRFRQAEPDIFLENQKLFETDENSDVKFLNCNFRSEKKILDFVNLIFNKIMTEKTCKIDYKNTSKLNGQAIYENIANQNLPSVEINVIKKEKAPEKPLPNKIYKIKDHLNAEKTYTTAECEGFVVAKKILDLIGKKIYIPSLKTEKEIEFKDITILLRGRGSYLNEFCGVLSKFNIPLYANTNESLYEDSDIKLLLNILSLCVNKNDDIALASVMHSVFGGFSFNQMSKIRLQSEKNTSYYNAVLNYAKNDEIKLKITELFKVIDNLTFNIKFNGIYLALNEIINEFNYLPYVMQKDDGLEKIEKIKKFLNDFLNNNFNFDLIGFLDFAERNAENIISPNFASGENCVAITTIHSSKGLEFPVVILANAGKGLNKEPDDKSIQLNQKLGLGLKYFDFKNRKKYDSIVQQAILAENFNDDFAEKLRLLYVALTRAKNHLIIVGTTSKEFNEIKTDFEVFNQNSYLDLIINSLPKDDIEKINLNENVVNELYNINVISSEIETNFAENSPLILPQKNDEKLEQKIKKYYEFNYSHKTDITTKNSVSSILQAENPYTSQNNAPQKFTLNEHSPIKANDLGIIYHKIFELIDFNKVSLEKINQLINDNFAQFKEQINAEKILNCIKLINKFNAKNIIKEQKFVMNLPYNQVVKSDFSDEILVQGIVDLIILGQKNILIDYKLTNITDKNALINKYYLQLKLYKKATELALNIRLDEIYILNINLCELISVKI